MKEILIVGAGLSGCTAARLLQDQGINVSIIEKESYAGGLCITRLNPDGLQYEPFGARTFHTNDARIRGFITRFDAFNGYTHRKGMIIQNRLFPFPLTKGAINGFEDKEKIFNELKARPERIHTANFEEAAISIFGKTLYGYFIGNYTAKMWGRDPHLLTAEWAPKRLQLREDGQEDCFLNQWQGLPKNGYSFLVENMAQGIPARFNTTSFSAGQYDLVVSTAPIDEIMGYRFGPLQYRSLNFEYRRNELWEKDDYGTINLPQHERFIRKCNFNILHKVVSADNWIQYQEPMPADEQHVPMYPVNTLENNAVFDKYLREICKTNIFPLGRLGLFKYLDMDKAVLHVFEFLTLIMNYLRLTPEERYESIRRVLDKF